VGSVSNAFIRTANGTFTTFIPGGGTSADGGAINNAGTMTGDYFVSGHAHGFIREADGSLILPIDADTVNGQDTKPFAINDAGGIAGVYSVLFSGDVQGFYRDPAGAIKTFSCGINVTSGNTGMSVEGLTRNGAVLGACVTDVANGVTHGFKWAAGTIRTIEPPGAADGIAFSENRKGQISGIVAYAAGDTHGFLATGAGK
jgi:uncharacterized membrane protein